MLETRVFGEEDLLQHLQDLKTVKCTGHVIFSTCVLARALVPSSLRKKADELLSKKLERIVRLIRPALALKALPTGRVRLPSLLVRCMKSSTKKARRKVRGTACRMRQFSGVKLSVTTE